MLPSFNSWFGSIAWVAMGYLPQLACSIYTYMVGRDLAIVIGRTGDFALIKKADLQVSLFLFARPTSPS